ncbi:MAG: molybdenum cofactor guanylyltransferase [Candidatus Eremiobacteraeota bacterium]|nr:molybdenum cofactor guanylyltransferase [Candidatus Eremiobacteraeota bacterium]
MPESPAAGNTEILLLAGGAARRFPGKLFHPIDGTPMLVRTYEALKKTGWPIRVLADRALPAEIAASLAATVSIDRRPYRGPLFALLETCDTLCCEYVVVAAADLPAIDAGVLHALAAAWRPGDDAVVPIHDGSVEPLAALYRRGAILDASRALRRDRRRSMRALIERLPVRFVSLPAQYFVNVNHPNDLSALGVA